MADTDTSGNLPELKVIQQSFVGGMKRSVDPTKLNDTQYTILINGRSRYDTITPIKLPTRVTAGLPDSGIMQGCYGAGTVIIIFISGKAYYRDFATNTNFFLPIKKFSMSETALTLWAELVPASTVNFKRIPVNAFKESGINLTTGITGTPQCVVVQDGENQPWLIFPDGSSRISSDYSKWDDANNREYVPIGKQMLYIDGILHIVSVDGTQIYDSITGRPLDFVKVIDKDGNKLPSEDEGGAAAVSHKVDYFPITCIGRIDTPVQGGYLVGTSRSSYLVAPDFNNTLFGEPTYTNTFLFGTGPLNQFCVTDILGDTAFIDFAGLRSFNAVTQYRFEGRNSPFSQDIFAIFNNIIQDSNTVSAWSFDNYGLFSVNTIYGTGVVVYDSILKSWVGIDIYGTSAIKQFCEIKLNGIRELFFITVDSKFYQAFGSDETATAKLYTKEYSTLDPELEFTPEVFRAIFLDAKENGTAKVTAFVNRKKMTTITKSVKSKFDGSNLDNILPMAIPFGSSKNDTTENLTYKFQALDRIWKAGFLVEWDFMSDLSHVMMIGVSFISTVSKKSQASYYQKASKIIVEEKIIIGLPGKHAPLVVPAHPLTSDTLPLTSDDELISD